MRAGHRGVVALAGLMAVLLSAAAPPAAGLTGSDAVSDTAVDGTTARVSLTNAGSQSNGWSERAAVSADGRYIAFHSGASDLVPEDTNDAFDIFLRDRGSGTTERVSLSSSEEQANSGSTTGVSISADGALVAFGSMASNLVPGDTNETFDVFVRDLRTGTTALVSQSTDGTPATRSSGGPSVSADGRFVAFESFDVDLVPGDADGGEGGVFVRDLQAGTTTRVDVSTSGQAAGGYSRTPAVSADGRYVAFASYATNLVRGDTNRLPDVFVRDRQAGTTRRVSISSQGKQANTDVPDGSGGQDVAISADGRYVAFTSAASNLVPGDTNRATDAFVRDLRTRRTSRVSVASSGAQAEGRTLEVDVSADARYVMFISGAWNLVPGAENLWDVFLRDRATRTTTQVSVSSRGVPGNADSMHAAISADGQHVAFTSEASNLIPGDTRDATWDVYVRDLEPGPPHPAPGQAVVENHRPPLAGVYYQQEDRSLVRAGTRGQQNLGGVLTSGVAVIDNQGRTGLADHSWHVYARGADNAIWYRSGSPEEGGRDGAWGQWHSLGGRALGAPAVSCPGPEVAPTVWVRGADGALWVLPGDGSPWAREFSWQRMGGRLASDPAADPGSCSSVFALGTDHAVWEFSKAAADEPGSWYRVGGRSTAPPATLGQHVFARGTDSAVWMATRVPGPARWSSWRSLGGYVTSPPSASYAPDGSLEVLALGASGQRIWRARSIDGGTTWTWTPRF